MNETSKRKQRLILNIDSDLFKMMNTLSEDFSGAASDLLAVFLLESKIMELVAFKRIERNRKAVLRKLSGRKPSVVERLFPNGLPK